MADREAVEKLLVEIRDRREQAEAQARHAQEDLVREASGLTALANVDPGVVRAAADTYAGAVERLRELERFARDLRALIA